jgi:hypothetical protein
MSNLKVSASPQPAMSTNPQPVVFAVDDTQRVSGLLQLPPAACACYVMAHGAGAGMAHSFMANFANDLASRGIATLRYQFFYIERGSKRPDAPQLAHAAVRAAVAAASRLLPDLALFAGGKSYGGHMTSQAQGIAPLPGVRGPVSGLSAASGGELPRRAQSISHCADPDAVPCRERGTSSMDLRPMKSLAGKLGAHATLRPFEDADHSFHVPTRTGRKDAEVRAEMADAFVEWIERSPTVGRDSCRPHEEAPRLTPQATGRDLTIGSAWPSLSRPDGVDHDLTDAPSHARKPQNATFVAPLSARIFRASSGVAARPNPSMIRRAARTCAAFDSASLPGPSHRLSSSPTRTLPPIAATLRRSATGCGRRRARSTGTGRRTGIGGALHVLDVFRMRANAAEDSEHALDEERRLDDAALEEVMRRIQVADVVALDLEAGAVARARGQDVLDILERVAEDPRVRACQILALPVVLELP